MPWMDQVLALGEEQMTSLNIRKKEKRGRAPSLGALPSLSCLKRWKWWGAELLPKKGPWPPWKGPRPLIFPVGTGNFNLWVMMGGTRAERREGSFLQTQGLQQLCCLKF